MSNELLQKVIDTGAGSTSGLGEYAVDTGTSPKQLSGNGLLYPDQANRFLDYMWDATILAKTARTIRMRSNTTEIDRVSVNQRIMTVAAEDNPVNYYDNTGTGTETAKFTNRDAKFAKISLTTRKLRLDWELSAESLEDNIEGPDLEDHIARLMATQAGNDVEDVLINGTGTGSGLISAFRGFRQLALDNGHVLDAAGYGLDKTIFNAAIKQLPRKYKQRRNQLRFFTGSNLVQDYLYNLTAMSQTGFTPFDIASSIVRGEVAANDGGPGTVTPFAFGIPVVNVPLIDETARSVTVNAGSPSASANSGLYSGDVHLTFPQNFIIGIKRDVVVYRLFQPKKDTIEYTLFIRVGCQLENYDAHVIVKNIAVGGTTAPFGVLTGGAVYGQLAASAGASVTAAVTASTSIGSASGVAEVINSSASAINNRTTTF
ncbi:MAG: phage major capsid protein [Alphaproteobacteria bacterium]|nr:phage major capsid protein [Alphaproteobacteria bacterium]